MIVCTNTYVYNYENQNFFYQKPVIFIFKY